MAVITRQDIETLAHQACLDLDAGAVEQSRRYLETILDLLETLRAVDVRAAPPFVIAEQIAALHDPPGPTTLREDGPSLPAVLEP